MQTSSVPPDPPWDAARAGYVVRGAEPWSGPPVPISHLTFNFRPPTSRGSLVRRINDTPSSRSSKDCAAGALCGPAVPLAFRRVKDTPPLRTCSILSAGGAREDRGCADASCAFDGVSWCAADAGAGAGGDGGTGADLTALGRRPGARTPSGASLFASARGGSQAAARKPGPKYKSGGQQGSAGWSCPTAPCSPTACRRQDHASSTARASWRRWPPALQEPGARPLQRLSAAGSVSMSGAVSHRAPGHANAGPASRLCQCSPCGDRIAVSMCGEAGNWQPEGHARASMGAGPGTQFRDHDKTTKLFLRGSRHEVTT